MATLAKLVLFLLAVGVAAAMTLRLRTVTTKDSYGSRTEQVLGYSVTGGAIGVLIVILAFALMPSFGYIPVGHRGVVIGPSGIVMRGGTGYVLGEGFYFLLPFLYNVELLSVRTEAYTTEAEAASSDLQDVKAKVVINYRLAPENVWSVYQQLGSNFVAKVFEPAVQEALKASTAQFSAEDLIQQRPKVSAAIRHVLEERGKTFGFEVQAVSITQFNFSEEFNHAIEQKAKATQEAETARRIKEKIRAEQESKILEYQADATRRKLELEAQALGQKAQLAYITPQLIQLRRVEATLEFARRWDGKMPLWMTGDAMNMFLNVTPPTSTTEK